MIPARGLSWLMANYSLMSFDSGDAVMAFARASGEVASLSAVDIKLIALAHTFEVAAHGSANLRSSPPAPRTRSKGSTNARKLPGWGEEGADWDALDQDAQDSHLQQGILGLCISLRDGVRVRLEEPSIVMLCHVCSLLL